MSGRPAWIAATDPGVTAFDSDPNTLTGITIQWSQFTLKSHSGSIVIPGGSVSGLDENTHYHLYWDIEDQEVKVVSRANVGDVIDFKHLLFSQTEEPTPEDRADGSDSGSTGGLGYGTQF